MKRLFLFAAPLLCLAASPAKPVKIQRDSKALEFTYAWSTEAAAIPSLNARFRSELAKAYMEALATARQNQKTYRSEGRGDIHDYYSKVWTTAGQTARLLSLQTEFSTFTGGAHPNTSYDALIWDRARRKVTGIDALFGSTAAFSRSTRSAYCKALDRERLDRRRGEKLDLPEFEACPKFSELAIAPTDHNRNGRFDALEFVASPYVAGPYAEGAYKISLPVTKALVDALRPEYRPSFEVQRQ